MSELLLNVLLTFIVLLCVAMTIAMFLHCRGQVAYYQKRNELLSTLLADSAVKFSEERSSIIERASKEREQMRTELLLQCDSMSRNTLDFLKQGLLESLQKSDKSSDAG